MSRFQSLWARAGIRRLAYLLALVLLWQLAYMSGRFPELLFPSVGAIVSSLFGELMSGSLIVKTGFSLSLILIGIGVSLVLALVLTALGMLSGSVKDLLKLLISIFDPLPGIALLPLAILWFGINNNAIIFVMVHSVLWPMLLNVLSGFDSVPVIYQDVGRSFGLSRLKMTGLIYAPASLPSILTGIKTGWARAWRALISSEMVFGATSVTGGLGWDIYTKRSYLDMPGMFATLIVIMVIGILVEDLLFQSIEKATLQKWGMVR